MTGSAAALFSGRASGFSLLIISLLLIAVQSLAPETGDTPCGAATCLANEKCCNVTTSTCCLEFFQCCGSSCCNIYTQICTLSHNCLELSAIFPKEGPTSGGTSVDVYGSGFSGSSILCRFGGHSDLPGTIVSPSLARCPSPAQSVVGTVELSVSVDSGSTFSHPLNFTFYASPVIDNIYPLFGPVSGGTVLVIAGDKFDTGVGSAGAVKFGEEEVTPLQINNTMILVQTPKFPGATSDKSISVSLNGVDFVTYDKSFVVYNDPSISDISPQHITGDHLPQKLTLYGTNFYNTGALITVRYTCDEIGADISALGTYVSQTEIDAEFHPNMNFKTPKRFNISVSLNAQQYSTASNQIHIDFPCDKLQTCTRCLTNDSCGWCMPSGGECLPFLTQRCSGALYHQGCPYYKAELSGFIVYTLGVTLAWILYIIIILAFVSIVIVLGIREWKRRSEKRED